MENQQIEMRLCTKQTKLYITETDYKINEITELKSGYLDGEYFITSEGEKYLSKYTSPIQ